MNGNAFPSWRLLARDAGRNWNMIAEVSEARHDYTTDLNKAVGDEVRLYVNTIQAGTAFSREMGHTHTL